MRAFLVCLRKDLRRALRDVTALLIWIGIPLFVGAALTLVFGRGEPSAPQGKLLIADQDGSFVARFLAGAFEQGPLGGMFATEKTTAEEGRRRMDKGEATGLVIIPAGFGRAVVRSEPTELTLITNPAQRILPNILKETLRLVGEAVFYFQQAAGEGLRSLTDRQPSEAELVEIARQVNRAVEHARPWIDPLRIDVKTQTVAAAPAAPRNLGAAFFPGMLMMAVLFTAVGLSQDYWRERALGTLRRLAATPVSLGTFLAAKAATAALIVAVVGGAGLAGLHLLLGVPVARPVAAVAWLAGSGTVLYLLAMLAQTLARSERAGNTMVNICMFPLAMLGGSFFPFEFMPRSLAGVGRLTPNGWALTQFKALIEGSAAPAPWVAAVLGLVGLGVVLVVVVERRLGRAIG